ncbi:ComEA family DNA-binding protein [Paenibacillus sp. 23TSA30-6]|uniref:ComEA family DNA-binding protein n=1 Tax=Paenibacillus sp. 23TSA30-6 TaxID=2546104 RepID=UPI001787F7FB|nr:ComEA family DNA-binding protein [Paenibacillus sp. 23TSA30-6]MBE0337213.1 helix-hairpin-helix domain-containing protein [Paenibacillus sp. 23TSA30-6]
MNRVWTGTAIVLSLIGSGLILFAGGQRPGPEEEWQLLNRKVEQALVEPDQNESQSNSGLTQGKRVVTETSGKTERSSDGEGAGNVKRGAVQGSASASVDGSESSSTVKQPEATDSGSVTSATGVDNSNTTTNRTNAVSDPVASSASGEKKVNINTATAAELMELPGVGAKKAEAILNYRNQHGPFKRVNDLDHVKGIGAKMLAKMKPYVSL